MYIYIYIYMHVCIYNKCLCYSNFSKEEWECKPLLANDRSIVIKSG